MNRFYLKYFFIGSILNFKMFKKNVSLTSKIEQKLMKKLVFIILSLFLFSSVSYSQAGSDVYSFLSLPPSSHIAALGGTNISLCDKDLNFSLQNPALLKGDLHNTLSLNGTNYLSDINFGSASYAYQLDEMNMLALGVLFVDYGDFKETSENNEELGQFTANDVALSFIYGRKLSERWMLGATLKPIFSSYESYSSFALAVDLGTSYCDKEHFFSSGLVFKNIGRQLSGYYKEAGGKQHIEDLPFEIQAGVTKKLQHAPFRFTLTAHNLQRWNMGFTNRVKTASISGVTEYEKGDFNFGQNLMRHLIFDVEFLPSDNFYIAVGYNYRRGKELKVLENKSMAGFSFGAGLKLYKFNVGFAVAKYHASNSSLHFSISTNLDSFHF